MSRYEPVQLGYGTVVGLAGLGRVWLCKIGPDSGYSVDVSVVCGTWPEGMGMDEWDTVLAIHWQDDRVCSHSG